MSEGEFALLDRIVLAPLKAVGVRLFLFGSRARGDHSKFSDVDLLLEGEVDFALLANVREQIEESLFPYAVDIVEAGSLAESYRPGVWNDRVPL